MWHPDWRTALPRVFYVRWWLFRLGMVVVVLSVGAAAMLPRPPICPGVQGLVVGGGPHNSSFFCDTSWHIGPRLAIMATGIVLALVLAFFGARLDGLARRHRGARYRMLDTI
jgi:hypothetical protein